MNPLLAFLDTAGIPLSRRIKVLSLLVLTSMSLAQAQTPAANVDATPAATISPLGPVLKPIRLVVPYAPGGPIDVTARALAERVKDSLGAVIIENKPGAGGNLGVDIVAKAPADSYTCHQPMAVCEDTLQRHH